MTGKKSKQAKIRHRRKPAPQAALVHMASVTKTLKSPPFDITLHLIVFCIVLAYIGLSLGLKVRIYWIELAAGGLNLISMVLTRRQNPTGLLYSIATCVLFFIHFLRLGIYGQAALQLYFITMSSITWRRWTGRAKGAEVKYPTFLPWSTRFAIAGGAGALLGSMLLFGLRKLYTLDYTNVALNLLNQFLLMNKKVEFWAISLATNFFAILLFWTTKSYVAMSLCIVSFTNSCLALPVWYTRAKRAERLMKRKALIVQEIRANSRPHKRTKAARR